MRAIVLGATGATGKPLIEVLIADQRYVHIISFVRRSSGIVHPKLTEYVIDFKLLGSYVDFMQADVFFNCMGTTLKAAGSQAAQRKVDFEIPLECATLAQQKGVSCCVLVSSINANSNSKFFYPKIKGELEDALRKLNMAQYIIFRPGILDRPNTDRTLERITITVIGWLNSIGVLKRQAPLRTTVLAQKLANAPFQFPKGESIVLSDQIALL